MTIDEAQAQPKADDEQDPSKPDEEAPETAEEPDQPQDAWRARRELYQHAPSYGGSLVGGSQHGVSGGQVTGDVIMGGKTEIHYRFGGGAAHASGKIPQDTLDRLAQVFAEDGDGRFAEALRRLGQDRVVVLSGAPFTGRRSAALMLLHRLGAAPVRALDPKTRPAAIKDELSGSRGYLLCDLATDRDRPLRDIDLWAAREKLDKDDGYLVITTGLHAALHGIRDVGWRPPTPEAVLRTHLSELVTDPEAEQELLRLEPVRAFLSKDHHQLREAAGFAGALAEHARGMRTLEQLERFGQSAVREQVQEWFDDEETPLRDKAFLVSLAAFDEAPYALTAELSDLLYAFLQNTEDPALPARIPVFGTSIGKRLRLARARPYEEEEHTEWGPVSQLKAAFHEPLAAIVLLREVWTGHPSARPALVRWLRRLAEDGRPLVRTRAAVTAAVLAHADLPSAMALLIQGWAGAKRYRFCLVAANTLALAHSLGTPNIPGILRSWCAPDQPQRLRWTAIRAYALVGPGLPGEALAALAEAARSQDEQETEEIAQSTELLLTVEAAQARSQVLTGLIDLLQEDRPVRHLALRAFVRACKRTEDDAEDGRPLLLDWYARAAAGHGTEDDRHLAALWRGALGDRAHTADALEALRRWVRRADTDPDAERALAGLLPALAVTAEEHKRLSHALRTLRGEHDAPPPAVAERLLAVLTTP